MYTNTQARFLPLEKGKELPHPELYPSPGCLFGMLVLLHISEKTATIITFYPEGKLSVTNSPGFFWFGFFFLTVILSKLSKQAQTS